MDISCTGTLIITSHSSMSSGTLSITCRPGPLTCCDIVVLVKLCILRKINHGGETGTRGEAANHGAKALSHRGDGAAVGAILCHTGIPVQQGIAGHPHVVEPDLAVVHSVQPCLRKRSGAHPHSSNGCQPWSEKRQPRRLMTETI